MSKAVAHLYSSVFYRYNGECTEAFQEFSSEKAVLFFHQEVQGGTEESTRPADGICHYKTGPEAHACSQ